MTTEQDSAPGDPDATVRQYQLAGFVVGVILGLLVVVPLAFIIIN